MRRMIEFDCCGDRLIGTLDETGGKTGLLIVSGGNEVRTGAYGGQAALARHIAALGHPVFRYDRRGIGDSEGMNSGFEGSGGDIAAAVTAFRKEAPQIERLVAFGNCDAATALGIYHQGLEIDALLLANPWVVEKAAGEDSPAPPNAGAIRARYLERLKNPRSMVDLLTGKIDLKKLAGGLAKAAQKDTPSGLADRLAAALATSNIPLHILVAKRDTTAMAFATAWRSRSFADVRDKASMAEFNTPSHSFADGESRTWLYSQISARLA